MPLLQNQNYNMKILVCLSGALICLFSLFIRAGGFHSHETGKISQQHICKDQ